MKGKALITGINGQAGSYFADRLITEGVEVVGVHRRSSTDTSERIQHVKDNIKMVEGDLCDPSSIYNLVVEEKPDYIINTAAQSHVKTSFEQPQYTFQVNTIGLINILEAVRQFSPKTRVLHFSTSEMFGSNFTEKRIPLGVDDFGNIKFHIEKYQDEDTVLMGNSPYGCSKIASHHLISNYRRAYGTFASTIISFNYESERRGENFVTRKITKYVAKLLHAIQLGNPLPDKLRLGNLNAYRDWSHAEDVINAGIMILEHNKPDDFVICSGETHTIKDFLELAFGAIGENWENWVEIDPAFFRPCEVEYLRGSAAKAKRELGWLPTVSFKELVGRMLVSDIEKQFGDFVYANLPCPDVIETR